MKQTVEQFLDRSNEASAIARMRLGAGCSVAIWQNQSDRIYYESPSNHAFSLYLNNGTGTRRLDAGGVSGWPGAVCVMPAGHRSDWEITTVFQFVHLYLSDEKLRAQFSKIHDCDARHLELSEETFVQKPEIAKPLAELARAALSSSVLQAECALSDLIGQLRGRTTRVVGGLAPHVLRRVEEYVEAHLSETISLDDLASLSDVSGFHFHRMFRLVRGCTPHTWIATRRIDRAKRLLGTNVSISEISVDCGFSSHSHLTRVFRKVTGVTPNKYRSILWEK